MQKSTKKLRKAAIRYQNQQAGRGNFIPKIVEVINSMKAAAERAENDKE